MKEIRVDLCETTQEEMEENARQTELVFRLNSTLPRSEGYMTVLDELFEDRIGAGSFVAAPLQGMHFDKMQIGAKAYIGSNLLAMARGGITIEDGVQIASNVQLLTNNHDPYDRMVLVCRPILIREGAWIGAGATILPGVTIGRYAIIGAASVVTQDVPDYSVAVGSPARVIKTLDAERFVNAGYVC